MASSLVHRRTDPVVTVARVLCALVLVTMVAAVAGWLISRAVESRRVLDARTGLRRVRDALLLHQVRHQELPDSLTALRRTAPDVDLIDPWGNPYVLDHRRLVLVCTGPNGYVDGPAEEDPDDLFELLPPPPDLPSSPPAGKERTAPRIHTFWPTGTLTTRRPPIGATYGDDPESGIVDPSLVRLSFDGRDVTNQARITSSDLQWLPAQDLDPGEYRIILHVQTADGQAAIREWTFAIPR